MIVTYFKFAINFFQVGASADVYSLSIIIYELFSGIDPFPGNIFQIFKAIFSDKKPDVPAKFPSNLKELMCRGWSKDPKERPPIKKFKSALKKMLRGETETKKQEKRQLTLASDSGLSLLKPSKINVILGKPFFT